MCQLNFALGLLERLVDAHKVMNDGTRYNAGAFTPNKEAPPSNVYTGKWNLDRFDDMMTSIKGKGSGSLNVHCPPVYKELQGIARPYRSIESATESATEPASEQATRPAREQGTVPATEQT